MAASAPAVAPLLLGAGTAEEAGRRVLAAIDGFFRLTRAREDAWLLRTIRRVEGASQQDVLDVIADESARRAEFERRVRARIERDVARSLALERGPARLDALRGLLRREQVYARQRSEAMAARSLALADRIVLRRESPSGAFWKLGDATEHTADCLAMAGKFWPWEVLDSFHPQTHPGCVCSLHGYATAVANGWLRPDAVMDVRTALTKAAAARLLLGEAEVAEMRDALDAAGICAAENFEEALLRAGGVGS